jgi:hypothetical protein
MIPQQRGQIRGHILREESILYQADQDNNYQLDTIINWEELDNLLRNIPLPNP